MPLFRTRTAEVEAMFFDGTAVGALEIVTWARSVAPAIVIRERIEYRGWADRDGHLELEIEGNDLQAAAGDWLICIERSSRRHLEVEPDASFRRRFEPLEE